MRTLLLSALIALTLAAPLAAIDSSLTYQGTLEDAGTPATGAYDFEFKLQDTAGMQVGNATVSDNVAVTAGVFTVTLDFGNAAFTGPDRFLVISVRPGASVGAFTTLAPRTKITPAPYAQLADEANFAASVANDSIGGAQIVDGAVGASDIDPLQVQRRVSGACSVSQAVSSINVSGNVGCITVGTGDINSVTAGEGLSGGGGFGDLTLGIASNAVTSLMLGNGEVQSVDIADGPNGVQGIDIVDGTVGSADVNTSQIQRRLSSECVVGSAVRSVGADGTVVCQSTRNTFAFSSAGNAITATTTAQPTGTSVSYTLAQAENIVVTYGALMVASTNSSTVTCELIPVFDSIAIQPGISIGSNSPGGGATTTTTHSPSRTMRLFQTAGSHVARLDFVRTGGLSCSASGFWLEVRSD